MLARPCLEARAPTFVSLCSGIGGLDLGLTHAGFRGVEAIDLDRQAQATYEVNFPGIHFNVGDIRELPPDGDEIALLAGSPPCTSFSSTGKKKGWDDPAATAMWAYARLVGWRKPYAFIIENVPELFDRKHGEDTDEFLDVLRGHEYFVKWKILNAAEYGVAQKRKRAIIVGYHKDTWLVPDLSRALKRPPVTLSDAIGDLMGQAVPAVRWQKDTTGHEYYPHEPSEYYKQRPHRKKLDQPGLTVMANPQMQQLHPIEQRQITCKEGERIQGVPDSFQLAQPCSFRCRTRQFGNMVPPPFAYSLGLLIRGDLQHVGAIRREMFQRTRDEKADAVLLPKRAKAG